MGDSVNVHDEGHTKCGWLEKENAELQAKLEAAEQLVDAADCYYNAACWFHCNDSCGEFDILRLALTAYKNKGEDE